ncbi:hypothetical protein FHH43_01495 [Clostridium perfringens]|nr:hypothetical protein [Clostridium perfringens]
MKNISASLGNISSSLSLNLGGFQSSVNSAVRGFEDLQRASRNSSSSMESAGQALSKAGKGLSSFGSTMTKAVTLPIVGAGTAAVKMGMDMEAGVTKIIWSVTKKLVA